MGKCPKCGNKTFSARQQCYHDIVVDDDNDFVREIEVTDASKPYGPYECMNCGHEIDDLDDLADDNDANVPVYIDFSSPKYLVNRAIPAHTFLQMVIGGKVSAFITPTDFMEQLPGHIGNYHPVDEDFAISEHDCLLLVEFYKADRSGAVTCKRIVSVPDDIREQIFNVMALFEDAFKDNEECARTLEKYLVASSVARYGLGATFLKLLAKDKELPTFELLAAMLNNQRGMEVLDYLDRTEACTEVFFRYILKNCVF